MIVAYYEDDYYEDGWNICPRCKSNNSYYEDGLQRKCLDCKCEWLRLQELPEQVKERRYYNTHRE